MKKNLNFLSSSNFEKIKKYQEKLSKLVIKESKLISFKKIAGVDAAYANDIGVCVALNFNIENFKIIDKAVYEMKINFPYIPGFLAFHEGPLLIKTVKHLSVKPDLLLIDGHGIAHPRKCGLASFVGILLNMPTIGIAKKRLYGKVKNGYLYDEKNEVIGAIVKPINGKYFYVSIGHMVSLADALKIVLKCTIGDYPEPLRIAHKEAKTLLKSKLNHTL
ncbi:MAG: endonuclease V [Candidatus Bathyarchaeia archaeon]